MTDVLDKWYTPVLSKFENKIRPLGLTVDQMTWTKPDRSDMKIAVRVSSTRAFYDSFLSSEQFPWLERLVNMGGLLTGTATYTGKYFIGNRLETHVMFESFSGVVSFDPLEQEAAEAWDQAIYDEKKLLNYTFREVVEPLISEFCAELETADIDKFVDELEDTK